MNFDLGRQLSLEPKRHDTPLGRRSPVVGRRSRDHHARSRSRKRMPSKRTSASKVEVSAGMGTLELMTDKDESCLPGKKSAV